MSETIQWRAAWDEFKNSILREQWKKAGEAFTVFLLATIGGIVSAAMGWGVLAKICGVVGFLSFLSFNKHVEGTLLSIAMDAVMVLAAGIFLCVVMTNDHRDSWLWLPIGFAALMMLYWIRKIWVQVRFRTSQVGAFECRGRLYPMTEMVGAAAHMLEKVGRVAVPAPRSAYEGARQLGGLSEVVCSGCGDVQPAGPAAACDRCGASDATWIYGE
jgi:hypothetical protein